MRNTITLNGIASTTIAGLLIQELPAIVKPLVRTEIEEIDGRDGDIVTELGYSAYDKEITIGLYGTYDINAVIKYFASEGTVVFSNESDKYYRYKIIDQIDFERLVRYRTATVTFHCQPFKFPTTETPVQLGSGQTVSGEGTDITLVGTSLAPFASITPKGDTSQQTYTGKNLFNINTTPNWIGVDTTYSVSGNTLHVEGKWFVGISIPVEASTDYYVSATRKNLSGGSQAGYISVYGGHNTDKIASFQTNNGTFNSGNRASIYLVFYADNGTAGNYADFENIQLEKGTTGTDYEPYVGGTASPNPDYPQDVKVVTGEQTVKVAGKNLWGGDNPLVQTGSTTYPINLPAGTYTISATSITTTGEGHNFRMALNYSDGTYVAGNLKDDSLNLQLTATQAVTSIGIYSQSSYVSSQGVTTTFTNFMINSGSTAGDYEPYQSQNYELNLGKNLFTDTLRQGVTNYETNVYTPTNSARITSTDWIALPAGTYTFNAKTSLTKTLQVSVISFTTDEQFYNISGVSGIWKTLPATFTTPIPIKFKLNLSYTDSADITIGQVSNIMLEHGSIATTYAPYKTPLELCKIGDYQDYIYKSGGNWYKHEVIYKANMAELDWKSGAEGDTTNGITYYIDGNHGNPGGVPSHYKNVGMSNCFQRLNYTSSDHTLLNFIMLGVTTLIVNIERSKLSSADKTGLVAWLSANSAVAYFPISTPIETQITDTGLIAQLETLANANSYRGITYINTASDGYNLPVIIAATATGNMDGTVTNSGNTYSRPKLTIYGTGTIGIYLDGNQMFSVDMGDNDHITIDTNAMNAYKDTTDNLKNRLVTGDYSQFKLAPGANSITFTGNSTKCVVENYTRWL